MAAGEEGAEEGVEGEVGGDLARTASRGSAGLNRRVVVTPDPVVLDPVPRVVTRPGMPLTTSGQRYPCTGPISPTTCAVCIYVSCTGRPSEEGT